jgi:hypothetical protein
MYQAISKMNFKPKEHLENIKINSGASSLNNVYLLIYERICR